MPDISIRSPFQWRGTWSHERGYEPGDMVLVEDHHLGPFKYVGGFFVADSTTEPNGLPPGTQVLPQNIGHAQATGRTPVVFGRWTRLPNTISLEVPRGAATGMAWRSEWASSHAYSPGDVVRHDQRVFIAIRPIGRGGSEPPDSTDWELVLAPPSSPFRGAWNEHSSYRKGDIVVYGNSWFSPLADGPSTKPDDTTQWQLLQEFGSAEAVAIIGLVVSCVGLVVGVGSGIKSFVGLPGQISAMQEAAQATVSAASDGAAAVVRALLDRAKIVLPN